MNRLIAILLAIIIPIGLTSCHSGNQVTDNAGNEQNNKEQTLSGTGTLIAPNIAATNADGYGPSPPDATAHTEAPEVETAPVESPTPATAPTAATALPERDCARGEHNWTNWITNVAATCEAAGEEYRICTSCSTTEIRTTDALQHHYSDWVTQLAPTCIANGKQTRSCIHCTAEQTRTIDELDHQYQLTSAEQPTTVAGGCEIYRCSCCDNEYRVELPMLKAVDTDKCGESLIGKVLPNAPNPEFSQQVLDRWARELSQKESYAEGLIRFPGHPDEHWTIVRKWEMPYRYITNPFPYTTYLHDDYSEFYCWASEQEYADQRAVYQRVEEILAELEIDENTTQKDAIIRVNNWICDYKYYQSSDERNHDDTYFSLFRQDGVCHNYALAFQVLCLGAGIECHYYASDAMNHAWNKVYFSDGSFLWVDCTWNDSAVPNQYLLISTEQLLKDHML